MSSQFNLRGFSSRTVTGEDEFGQPIRRAEPLEFERSSSSQGVALSLNVFDGFANLNEMRAARADERATGARVALARARLRTGVLTSYHAARRAQLAIELEERLLASARERLEASKRLFAVAAQTQVDVLGAEIDVATQEQAVARALGDARKAELALREALGMPMAGALVLVDEPAAVFDPASLDVDALAAAAVAGSPRLTEADAQLAAAERRARAERGSRWPTVALSAGYGRQMSLSSYDALSELNPQNRNFDFGLSASFPIFTQFGTSAQIAAADARAGDAREDRRAAALAIERETRAAYIDLANAYSAHQLALRSAELSRERVELAQEQYRQGAIGFTVLQDVIDRAAGAERQLLQSWFDFADALAVLEERAGRTF